jgi:hypothetical protein
LILTLLGCSQFLEIEGATISGTTSAFGISS